jgi:hypothetical protein
MQNKGIYSIYNTGCLNWQKKTLNNCIFIYKDELFRLQEKLEFSVVESSSPFIMYDKNGQVFGIFTNQRECASKYGLSNKNISAVLNKTKKTHLGYIFEYLE